MIHRYSDLVIAAFVWGLLRLAPMYTCSCLYTSAHVFNLSVCNSFPFSESERKYKKLGKYICIKIHCVHFHSAVVV